MRYIVPVTPDGQVGRHWGRAAAVAVVTVESDLADPVREATAERSLESASSTEGGADSLAEGQIVDWRVYSVGWDVAHDHGPPGSHHDRVVAFLTQHGITHAVVDHMGSGMLRALSVLGISVIMGADGDARRAVELAIPRG